jgi:ectoine hydroxylase-related dioxygenase (phytanoyl-CoA dioxygenase family)
VTDASSSHCAELRERGFCVIPNLVPPATLPRIAAAYGRAFAEATPPDLHASSTGSNTRLTDFVNRGAEFDELYVLEPVLEACASVIGASFKLSWQGARTVLPGARAQGLHVDVRADQDAWPLVGFIVMVDEFRSDNGATRFVPGTHSVAALDTYPTNARPDSDRAELARGAPGSVIVYNGSTWHGFSANDSAAPRRSIQGAYIPRRGAGAVDWAARLRPETAARLTASAKRVLAVD